MTSGRNGSQFKKPNITPSTNWMRTSQNISANVSPAEKSFVYSKPNFNPKKSALDCIGSGLRMSEGALPLISEDQRNRSELRIDLYSKANQSLPFFSG